MKTTKQITKDVITHLDNQFVSIEKEHEQHKKRISKAINWYHENAIKLEHEGFSGNNIEVNGVSCVCVGHNFSGSPFFHAYFIFSPYNATDDCGAGCGNQYEVKF